MDNTASRRPKYVLSQSQTTEVKKLLNYWSDCWLLFTFAHIKKYCKKSIAKSTAIFLSVFSSLLLRTMPPCVQMSTRAGPNIPIVALFAALCCLNPSSVASGNSRRSRLPANKNCHVWLTGICSFWTYMLELITVTVAETRCFLFTSEDDTHGAAVVTMLQDSRGDKTVH